MNKENIHKVISILKEEFPKWNAPIVSLIAQKSGDPFKTLVCALISTRTKDETTAQACQRLFERVKDVKDLVDIDLQELESLIYPVGFYKNKARQLKELARIILEKYGGIVPDDLKALMELPGVGRKVANLVLSDVFKKPVICVDTHVHRISNRLGLVRTKTPEETEMELYRVLPSEYWQDYNKLLVAFGQTICKPIKPKCQECRIRDYCDYYNLLSAC